MNRTLLTLKTAHKTATIWYSYLIGGVLIIQSSWDQVDDYIPKKWRHIVLGVITALVIVDKIRRSRPDDSVPPNS
jgi:hypothetical protein